MKIIEELTDQELEEEIESHKSVSEKLVEEELYKIVLAKEAMRRLKQKLKVDKKEHVKFNTS